jgi:hypothetical protein
MPAGAAAPSWSQLGARARTWRLVHAGWSVAQLACLGLILARVAQRRRDPAVWAAVAFLAAEGAGLVLGRGNCPMGRVQEEWGDPVPFFELLLPPRAAKAAVPTLAAVAVAAIAALVLRQPGLALRAPETRQRPGQAPSR